MFMASGNIIQRSRHALRPVRQFLRESYRRLLRRCGLITADWQESLPEELQFWERALTDPDRNWLRSEYQERLNPALELQADLKALIHAPPGAVVRILDVGAGPLTRVGKHWAGRTLRLYPVDPLAEDYRALLARLRIQPPVATVAGHGEKLLEQFAENFFDLAYASNSLDHSYDPLGAIEQMFRVVKPGGHVYLWHFSRAGVTEGYTGLHQWNFEIKDGELLLTNGRGLRHELGTVFHGRGEWTCTRASFAGNPVVVGALRKLAACAS
jgi:SAM-dependent methyltransferase